MISYCKKILLLLLAVHLFGCSAPQIPPEVRLAEEQRAYLWRNDAGVYLPEEYSQYERALDQAEKNLFREKSEFRWFRNYSDVQAEFRTVLHNGNELIGQLTGLKQEMASAVSEQISYFQSRIDAIKNLTSIVNEGRLARKDLMKAELLLAEMESHYSRGDYKAAERKTGELSDYLGSSENALLPIINRYSDKDQISKWKGLAEETINESRKKGIHSIIVVKSDRTLRIYKNGTLIKKYAIGLGRNGTRDKLYAGDNATPEGRYKIIKKVGNSKYHKALLINYPNEEDKKRFMAARENGLIPSSTGIGSLIEIHGGGKDSMTRGCVSMDNKDIDEVFSMVGVGTPVTIVGAMDENNRLSSPL